eukprot:7152040-Pyramimonas_sp.AAC.1
MACSTERQCSRCPTCRGRSSGAPASARRRARVGSGAARRPGQTRRACGRPRSASGLGWV